MFKIEYVSYNTEYLKKLLISKGAEKQLVESDNYLRDDVKKDLLESIDIDINTISKILSNREGGEKLCRQLE